MNAAAIKARKSVRTFTDQPIAPETIAELERFIADDANPFGVHVTFRILDREKYGLSSPVILGAETYIGAKCKRQEHAELAFGYSFEKLVLFATTLGLGTVWLAGALAAPLQMATLRDSVVTVTGKSELWIFSYLPYCESRITCIRRT